MKHIRMYTLLIFILSVVISGCSSLTKSQVRTVSNYFQTVNGYSDYTIRLNKQMARIELNRRHLSPESYGGNSQMVESLSASFKGYRQNMMLQSELKKSIEEFDRYVKDYFLIIPGGFSVMKILENASVAVGHVFGLGSAVSSAFQSTKVVKVNPKKAKKLKSHIIKGKTLVEKMAQLVTQFADNSLTIKLKQENVYIKDNYQIFLNGLKGKPDSYEYYSKYNTIFNDHFKLLYQTELLAKHLKVSSDKLIKAQNSIIDLTRKKKKMEGGAIDVQELFLEINEMKQTIDILK